MEKKWKSVVHGGMCVVMFAHNGAALAQQAVQIGNGKDAAEGATTDAACAGPASVCTEIALLKAQLSAIQAAIPQQAATAVIGGVGVFVNTNNASAWLEVCGSYTTISMSAATTQQIVGAVATKAIRICDFDISNLAGTSTLSFVIGTGTNCANFSSQLGQAWYVNANWGKIAANPFYRGMNSSAVGSSALCVKSTNTTTFDVGVYYDQL